MPYLIESIEWRLFQELGRLLKSQLRRGPPSEGNGRPPQAELFEVELRQAFMVYDVSEKLNQDKYDEFQESLKRLCLLLNDLARPPIVDGGPVAHAYPALDALAKRLELLSGQVDLATGFDEPLFQLPENEDELNVCLSIVTEYNINFSRLCPPVVQETTIRSHQTQHKRGSWKKARIRNHATFVLGALFGHFKCGKSHEVFLKLTEDPDENSALPSLQIVFSLCLESETLQEAFCDPVHLDQAPMSSIPDICADLRQQMGQGKSLTLLVKEYGLFGTWGAPIGPVKGMSSKEFLHQLIMEGAFKPLDFNTLLSGAPPAKFSTRAKRELAVKLGFCLMDFFDADLASKQIYFLNYSNSRPRKEPPYLAFNSKLPASSDPYNFGMGHPALLSFAKLLLELDFGEVIDLSISPHNSKNSEAYVKLMVIVERLEQERSDSYVEAIRGCLVVHYKIAKKLRSDGAEGRPADLRIRKVLYKAVVKRLELGLAESIPRSAHKRRRSESPPPPSRLHPARSSSPRKLAVRPVGSKRTMSGHGRQITSEPLSCSTTSAYEQKPWARKGPLAGTLHLDTATDSLNRWFAELANMNAVVRVKPGERDSGSPHIRIAILDTGIENQCLNGIKEYEDFVDRRNESPLDSIGHGTNVFSLLRKVCDDADFFIGRVWEGTKATPDTPLLMGEAIDYARKVWKVDIIVLSSGFQTTQTSVGEAIERANMARILTFASPSNYGNMGDLYYPGRLYGHGKVICLFSTNSMVKSSTTKTFNPSPLDTAAHRTFAILGEDIFLENLREPLNGTSYSTAIGAGIAARILDFSRHPRFRDKLENIDDLWKVEGMLAVFGRMAKRTDNGYRCMAPWVICPRADERMERREARERQQSAVVDVLRDALNDIDRA
ncbi:subtilisin-like protein [Xylaria grammica]|nr:subtilisin-like protein [Xylaria grammica]